MENIIIEATTEAEKQELTLWYVLGFWLGLIGILIAYLRSPQTPVILLAKYQGDERVIFDSAYVEKSKAHQIKGAWIGFSISLGLGLIIFAALANSL